MHAALYTWIFTEKESKISRGPFFTTSPCTASWLRRTTRLQAGRQAASTLYHMILCTPTLASQWGDGSVAGSAISGVSTRHMYLSPDLQRLFILSFTSSLQKNNAPLSKLKIVPLSACPKAKEICSWSSDRSTCACHPSLRPGSMQNLRLQLICCWFNHVVKNWRHRRQRTCNWLAVEDQCKYSNPWSLNFLFFEQYPWSLTGFNSEHFVSGKHSWF